MPRRPDGHSRAHAAPPRKARAPAASSSTDKRRWRRSGRCLTELTTHFPFVVPNIWFYYIRFVGQSPNRWGTHGNSRFVRAARGCAFFRVFPGRGGAPRWCAERRLARRLNQGSAAFRRRDAPRSEPRFVPTWVNFFVFRGGGGVPRDGAPRTPRPRRARPSAQAQPRLFPLHYP